jgi:hypothetical protein
VLDPEQDRQGLLLTKPRFWERKGSDTTNCKMGYLISIPVRAIREPVFWKNAAENLT